MSSYTSDKDKLLKRLSRAEGQIRGISRMVAEDKYCMDVITQLSAVQAALDKVSLELLRAHAAFCLTEKLPEQQRAEKADELVEVMKRLLAR